MILAASFVDGVLHESRFATSIHVGIFGAEYLRCNFVYSILPSDKE